MPLLQVASVPLQQPKGMVHVHLGEGVRESPSAGIGEGQASGDWSGAGSRGTGMMLPGLESSPYTSCAVSGWPVPSPSLSLLLCAMGRLRHCLTLTCQA